MRWTQRVLRRRSLALTFVALIALTIVAGATAAKLKGRITADGSSTVGPYVQAGAELFRKKEPGVNVTVGISGTGGGFEKFCNGETDLQDASRPIKQSEAVKCRDNGVPWTVFTVANDGLTVVVNRENTWASCLTVSQLKKVWNAGSKVDNWNEIDPSFPNVPLKLFGPGTDSGTFDFFTEEINGKSKQSRSDYLASENDNVLVQGVAGERGGMGYFGFSYYDENKGKLKALRINGEKGKGCVMPSEKTVQAGNYKPLGRPLYVYAKKPSFKRKEVQAFIGFIFANEVAIAKRSQFISLTPQQLKHARAKYKQAVKKA